MQARKGPWRLLRLVFVDRHLAGQDYLRGVHQRPLEHLDAPVRPVGVSRIPALEAAKFVHEVGAADVGARGAERDDCGERSLTVLADAVEVEKGSSCLPPVAVFTFHNT